MEIIRKCDWAGGGCSLGPLLTVMSLPPEELYQSQNPSQEHSSSHGQPNFGLQIQATTVLSAFCYVILRACRSCSSGAWECSGGASGWEERKEVSMELPGRSEDVLKVSLLPALFAHRATKATDSKELESPKECWEKDTVGAWSQPEKERVSQKESSHGSDNSSEQLAGETGASDGSLVGWATWGPTGPA